MATLVFFHAHPDDEAIATGGSMAAAADAGHRVVLIVATGGEEGEVAEGFLGDGETLAEVRERETCAAATILGCARVHFLGYRDSGMMGEGANQHPDSFWQADVERAAAQVATILEEEDADVVTVYDRHGGYGHPDHIQVHRVGHRAAKLAATPRVFEATMNRDLIRRWSSALRAAGDEIATAADADDPAMEEVGLPDTELTTAVDVAALIDLKRAAMAAHASQIDDDSWFLRLPPEGFLMAFGTEWYRRTLPAFNGSLPRDREHELLG
jgi:LmbE family N-acetylglucosaminyl deacetylase